ncbi:MAG TPA: hypothetical protein VF545_02930 [Thermoleophilaceae bacterium]|jgi:hypothetical protein
MSQEPEQPKQPDQPDQEPTEDDPREGDGRPPKYDNAAEEGTIVDGGHSAAAIGETGAKGERVDG